MTRYEIYTDRFEFSSANSWASMTPDDIMDLYCLSPTCPHLEAGFDSLAEAKAAFDSGYRDYPSTRQNKGWAGTWLLNGTIAYLEENEYDEDGDLDQGSILEWAVEPYTDPYE